MVIISALIINTLTETPPLQGPVLQKCPDDNQAPWIQAIADLSKEKDRQQQSQPRVMA